MEPDSIFHWFAHQLTRLVPRGLLLLPANASQPLSLRAQHSFWKKVWSFILSCIRLTLLFGDIGGHANVSSHLCFNHHHERNLKQINTNICTIIFQSQPTTLIIVFFFFFFFFLQSTDTYNMLKDFFMFQLYVSLCSVSNVVLWRPCLARLGQGCGDISQLQNCCFIKRFKVCYHQCDRIKPQPVSDIWSMCLVKEPVMQSCHFDWNR